MRHLGTTPPFRGPDNDILPGSIAEIAFLLLGGFAQWVMIRGENGSVGAGVEGSRILLLIGRHDHVVPPEASLAYFEKLTAPAKEFVWFEESGHEPPAEEPDKFHQTMAERVRPVAVQ